MPAGGSRKRGRFWEAASPGQRAQGERADFAQAKSFFLTFNCTRDRTNHEGSRCWQGFNLEIPAMNKDKIEGGVRKTAGQFEETVGRAFQDKQTTGQGLYDQAAGAAQNAYGQAKDMVSQAGDNLSQTASKAQDQVASFEANLEERIKNNPLVAVGVAVGIGFVLGKIT
jgi:uncharacterized protein YjbJ (UPF0337 family)